MADAGVRQASADRTAALISADEMVFIDTPPNAVPIEHSTPGVDGELAPPRVAPLLAAPPSRGAIKSAKALKKVESLVRMSAVSRIPVTSARRPRGSPEHLAPSPQMTFQLTAALSSSAQASRGGGFSFFGGDSASRCGRPWFETGPRRVTPNRGAAAPSRPSAQCFLELWAQPYRAVSTATALTCST